MANRFPLVLDTTDGNKIKEIPDGDNLDLRNTSIVDVQNINALGTINAAVITVNGQRLVAQEFANLTDTPASYVGSEDYFVKVNATGNGLEYRPLSDLGNIDIDTITVTQDIIPAVTNTGNVGTSNNQFSSVRANNLIGNLRSFSGSLVFDAISGLISYGALQGAPEFLSEFEDDIGYLRTQDLDDALDVLFGGGGILTSDIQGSIFGDDSTMLVDAVGNKIVGDIENNNIDSASIIVQSLLAGDITSAAIFGPSTGNLEIDAGESGIINIGEGASTDIVNIYNAVLDTFNQGTGLGIGQITSATDLAITAGNRVKIEGGVPFRMSSTTTTEQLIIVGQNGDLIYNTTTDRVQIYQNGAWANVTGNVDATTGTSNFNDVVVAGNLTVQGTTTTIDTDNTTIKDNVIILNQGEAGAGVTLGTAGIEIERGTQPNKTFVWNEATDKWTLGAETFVAGTVEATTAFSDGVLNISSGSITGAVNGTFTTQVQAATFLGNLTGNVTGNAAGAHTGTFDGEVTGSVFGDDSTILVDGINNKVVGDIDTASLRTSEEKIALGENAGLTTQGIAAVAIGSYAGTTNQGDTAVAVGGFAGYNTQGNNAVAVGIGAGQTTQGDDTVAVGGNAGQTTQGANAVAVGVYAGKDTQGTNAIAIGKRAGETNQAANSIVLNATGAAVENTTASSTVIQPVRNQASANVAMYNPTTGEITHTATPGTLAANLDQTAITIGATTATTIGIGNAGSTTTVVGNLTLPNALIVGEITADNSISITTAVGDGNAISIGPQGTNTYVNLTADNIRFYGPVVTEIDATGGLKGSVVSSINTLLVDAVTSTIPSANVSGTEATNWDAAYGWGDHSIVGYLTSIPGTYVQQGEQFVGDVTGTVFADDSSVMVDAVNYAFIGDTMTLNVLTIEPLQPANGMIAVADGATWNPTASGVQTLVVYLGGAWRQIQTA